jgi:hypothetical protein
MTHADQTSAAVAVQIKSAELLAPQDQGLDVFKHAQDQCRD